MKDEGMKNVIKATRDLNEQFKLLVMYQNDLISFDDQVGLSGTASSRAITTAKIMADYLKQDFGKDTSAGGGAPQQTALEKRLEATQKKIDLMQVALDVISYQEDKINKKYDDRVAALEKVRQVNEQITRQQQMQLGLADAISKGDVAAAASAAQEMRASNASSALDSQGAALETQRKAELSKITAGGKNRSQLEAQIAKLEYKDNLAKLGNTKFGNFSSGGMVPAYFAMGGLSKGTDTVPAMLTPGEFVIKKSAVDRIGVGTLNKINGYANGGQVQGGTLGNSMYNSYSINLSINSNSDANDIANKVLETIRRVESQNIRSNRF